MKILNVCFEGEIETSYYDKEGKDKLFSVSRVSGEIIGDYIPTLKAKSTHVVNFGSSEWSFRTVADFGNSVQVLEC